MGINEYKGEKIISQLSARLVPPNHNYPDCRCIILLTLRHLYVLENNYDGTYDTHFQFVISEVDTVEKETYTNNNASVDIRMPSEDLMAILSSILGVVIPITGGRRVVSEKYLVIHYHTAMGRKERIYFNECSSGIRSFAKALQNLKAGKGN